MRLIEHGQQTSTLKPEADPARLATRFKVLVEGGLLVAHATGDTQGLLIPLAHIEHLIDAELGR